MANHTINPIPLRSTSDLHDDSERAVRELYRLATARYKRQTYKQQHKALYEFLKKLSIYIADLRDVPDTRGGAIVAIRALQQWDVTWNPSIIFIMYGPCLQNLLLELCALRNALENPSRNYPYDCRRPWLVTKWKSGMRLVTEQFSCDIRSDPWRRHPRDYLN